MIMKKILFLASCFAFSSCATILTGHNKTIMIKSNQEATIKMNGHEVGKTNQFFDVDRTNIIKLWTIEKEGCASVNYEMPQRTNWAYWANVPLCFVGVGFITGWMDAEYNNNWDTVPEHVVNLECEE